MNEYKMLTSNNIGKSKYIIIDELKKYLINHPKIESLILGVSGGADSALVAALAKEVCQQFKNNRDIKLIGRMLPTGSNTTEENQRGTEIGKCFCDDFDINNLQTSYLDLVHNMRHQLDFSDSEDSITDYKMRVRLGNIKARLRMIYLYDLSSKHNGMVLSTDNYTEYLLGFWTLHGDVGDYGMIQNLWKTEVYLMLDNIYSNSQHNIYNKDLQEIQLKKAEALRACREAVPTDGLGITVSDLDQFGGIASYEEVDKVFIEMIDNGYTKFIQQGEIPKVLTMYENTKFKRNNPFSIPREILIGEHEDNEPIYIQDGGWDRR